METEELYKIIGELYVNIRVMSNNLGKERDAIRTELEKMKGENALLLNKLQRQGAINGNVET